ncbi:MAG TPA: DNA-processing protein DprA [Solirubrobacteraceae bacterium]|nr:DNA-processing protein DprA [Solirubrobacteraceae bacterium]
MSDGARSPLACARCLRRRWLLAELSGPLDCCARDRARLLRTLALEDEQLIAALAGRRKQELRAAYRRFRAGPRAQRCETVVCTHSRAFPQQLRGEGAPRLLEVAGGVRRLRRLLAAPAVAILGARRPTAYGVEVARELSRALSACGVRVVAGVAGELAAGAHAGAREAGAGSVAVLGSGLEACRPAAAQALAERVAERGCAVSELPRGCSTRLWGQAAGERTVVGLCSMAVLVEADDVPAELAGARLALAHGRALGAVPGSVSSRASAGPHALLREGASVIRGARDVLELLGPLGEAASPRIADGSRRSSVPGAAHRALLERIGCGEDTAAQLLDAGADEGEVLLALAELELSGVLTRGAGGRYLLRGALADL